MEKSDSGFEISRLGQCRIPSPMADIRFVEDEEYVLFASGLKEVQACLREGGKADCFELAGPRKSIYFDPSKLKCGIVTCGGLCPGLNDVIRAVTLSLHHHYGIRTMFGFRYGFEGLSSKHGHPTLELTPAVVRDIHREGGTILGSSRGPQDVVDMVDNLERMNVGVLFAIGGDGTLRGARAIAEEIARRGLKIGIIGIPKTIDNDIYYVQRSFGFQTAVGEASRVIYAAHSEAEGARNGIGLVKLMGRHSGFVAAYATLSSNEVNFCVIPEVKFSLDRFLQVLRARLDHRGHAVIVVGEGAGQELLGESGEKDPSGNVRLGDIGLFLRDQIRAHFKRTGMEVNLRYIDPSYIIRSMPADPHDSAFCLLLGHNAVHAAMTGRTNMVVGFWKDEFTHVPIPMAVSRRHQINPDGKLWTAVRSTTGQPKELA
ncbi:MAG: ATP-dependent 6-phosphofructokinase [Acidobacteriota bacterium]